MQDLKSIRIFLKVAELSSFAAAARAFAMTPASVTRIVARLEADLGQQLLVRTTRQVALTSAGALVVKRFAPIVHDFDRVAQEVARAVCPDHGSLAINAPMSLGLRLLPDLIAGFQLAYPNIAVDITLTDALIDIVDVPSDIAVRISGPPGDKSTIWRKICKVPRSLVAAPALFERSARPLHPDDLDPDLCLSYSARNSLETWTLHTSDGEKRTLKAGAQVVSNNGDFLNSLVASGNGIALLPDFITSDGRARGTLEAVLPDWMPEQLWLTLFYPPYAALPPLVATFSDYFEAYMRDVDALEFDAAP